MRITIAFVGLGFLAACATAPAVGPDPAVRTLMSQARAIASGPGERIWPGFASAPFGMLLVEDERETLFCHPGEAETFTPAGYDPLTECSMQSRPRRFNTNLLAAFPAVEGRSTIVMGTPEGAGRTPESWATTILHEHFHQMQTSQPNYYARVEALGLQGDDQTGMWMLNYTFPYDAPGVAEAAEVWARTLLAALDAVGRPEFAERVRAYRGIRATMAARVSAADWRYAEFQLWQEGVALWTELAVAREAGQRAEADRVLRRIRDELASFDLSENGRVSFYALGAAEAELLEHIDPRWRARYFSQPFALGALIEETTASITP